MNRLAITEWMLYGAGGEVTKVVNPCTAREVELVPPYKIKAKDLEGRRAEVDKLVKDCQEGLEIMWRHFREDPPAMRWGDCYAYPPGKDPRDKR